MLVGHKGRKRKAPIVHDGSFSMITDPSCKLWHLAHPEVVGCRWVIGLVPRHSLYGCTYYEALLNMVQGGAQQSKNHSFFQIA